MHSRYPTPRSAALLLALALSSAFAAEPRYEVLDLRELGFRDASALNNLGHVAGRNDSGEVLLWDGNTVARIMPPGEEPFIQDLNDSGVMIGYSSRSTGPSPRSFTIADGDLAEMEDPFYSANVINNQGQIALMNRSRAFISQAGSLTDIGSLGGSDPWPLAINAAGWVVGSSPTTQEPVPRHAFFYRNGTITALEALGDDYSAAWHLNDAGNIVGDATDNSGVTHATLHTGGRMLQIASANPPQNTSARRINNYNVVAGDFPSIGIWRGGVLKRFGDFINFESLGLVPVNVIDFNDRGQLLVSAFFGPTNLASTTLLLTPRELPPARLTALAARASAGTNDQTSIAGFVLAGGSTPGSVLLRTVGPGLVPLGVSNAATDPAITVFNSSNAVVATNDNWSADETDTATLAATAARLGAQPLAASSTDAALLANLSPGAYTAHASNPADPSRIVLTEIYDAGDETAARLTAAAIRLQIGTGESIGIVGFALAGDGPAKVLLRALGPALAERGVTGTLADPQLWLYRGNQPVMANDDWGSAATTPLLASKTTQAGLPALPDASKDSALLIQLEPGAYSLHVSGVGDTTGVALVEVYLVED